MNISIATCAGKSGLTAGDRLFQSELKALGIDSSIIVWDEALIDRFLCDGLVIRSVWDYHLASQKFRKWVEETSQHTKLLNSKETIFWNMDKSYLLGLIDDGVGCVPSLLLGRESATVENLEEINSLGWQEIVVKPTISASAFLTFRSSSMDITLAEKMSHIKKHSDILIQPYMASIETDGEVSFIFFNGYRPEYSHAILKTPAWGDFRVQSDFGGREVLMNPNSNIIEFAESVLQKVPGRWLFARVDVIDWKTTPVISELELIEPDLFLGLSPGAAMKFAKATMERFTE